MRIEIFNRDEALGSKGWAPRVVVELNPEVNSLRVWADEANSADNGTPESVWAGRVLRWESRLTPGAKAVIVPEALRELAERIAPLAEQVLAGHVVEWDGSKYVGRLTTPAARDAAEEIERIMDELDWETMSDGWTAWDAREWLWGSHYTPHAVARDIDLKADATDDDVARLAEELADEARANKQIVEIGELEDAILELRDELRTESDDDDDEEAA